MLTAFSTHTCLQLVLLIVFHGIVAAARKFIKKSVFCIDNVSVSHTAEDIQSLVYSMAIDVVSCFEVKPRRRRNRSESFSIVH